MSLRPEQASTPRASRLAAVLATGVGAGADADTATVRAPYADALERRKAELDDMQHALYEMRRDGRAASAEYVALLERALDKSQEVITALEVLRGIDHFALLQVPPARVADADDAFS